MMFCANVGSGGSVGMADIGVSAGVGIGAGVGVAVVGVGVAVVGSTVAVPKGRVAKDATPVAGVAGVAVTPAVANGVVVSALLLGSFPNNLINTVLSSDSPNVSIDLCNLGIVFCT